MDFILNHVKSVSDELKQFAKNLPDGTIGKNLTFFDETSDEVEQHSVFLVTIPEDRNTVNNFGTGYNTIGFRRELYSLYTGNWYHTLYDLGEYNAEHNFSDTIEWVKDFTNYCVQKKIYPIIIGGTQALTYSLYAAFENLEQRINISVADARFDLQSSDDFSLASDSYLYHIIMHKPNYLNNFTNLGYQTFLNSQEEIQLFQHLYFDAYRLGVLKNDMELCEPVLRETDVLSIDFSSIRSLDIRGNHSSKVSGFSSDEICQLTRYAGLSSRVKVLGVFEFNPTDENDMLHGQVLAQMIWYFLEGLNFRKDEFPNPALNGFKKYSVIIEHETIIFYKSDATERWWMEINVIEDNKIKRRALIPCTYNDYLTAIRMEIPERWYNNKKRIEV